MAQRTEISWTDFSSNPLRYRDAAGKVVWACAKVSAGCANCYSEAIAHRYRKGGPFSLAQVRKVTPFLDEKECRRLLRSRKISGKRVFIGDMTDIFGEWVPFELLDRLFAVFALRPDVTFQILTKRPERMAEYLTRRATGFDGAIDRNAAHEGVWRQIERMRSGDELPDGIEWSLPNVWLGTSVEDQAAADERIPHLLQCPAVVRFLSAEPLLGPMRLDRWLLSLVEGAEGEPETIVRPAIDWCILGGESGPGARPCNIEWIRSIIAQCREAGVACFVKQLGSRPRHDHGEPIGWPERTKPRDRKGGDPAEWPADLRVREFPIGHQEAQNAQKETESV